jgi:hypothetical protein
MLVVGLSKETGHWIGTSLLADAKYKYGDAKTTPFQMPIYMKVGRS